MRKQHRATTASTPWPPTAQLLWGSRAGGGGEGSDGGSGGSGGGPAAEAQSARAAALLQHALAQAATMAPPVLGADAHTFLSQVRLPC